MEKSKKKTEPQGTMKGFVESGRFHLMKLNAELSSFNNLIIF